MSFLVRISVPLFFEVTILYKDFFLLLPPLKLKVITVLTTVFHIDIVARIMKNALPENAKISKEAKECMQECVSEFISFVTSEATERCTAERRKTVNGEDILFALMSLGFENYSEVLTIYLAKYRQSQAGKANKKNQETNEAEEEEDYNQQDQT